MSGMDNLTEIWRHFRRNEAQSKGLRSKNSTTTPRDRDTNYDGIIKKWKTLIPNIGDQRVLQFRYLAKLAGVEFAWISKRDIPPTEFWKSTGPYHQGSWRHHYHQSNGLYGWKVKAPFQINKFKDAPLKLIFRETSDYLRCCDRNWKILGDTPVHRFQTSNESYQKPCNCLHCQ